MSTAQAAHLVAELARRGVHLRVDDGRLAFRAPAGALTEDLRAQLAECRDEVLRLLSAAPTEFALTGRQLQIWLIDRRFGSSVGYHLSGAFRLDGVLDRARFAAAARAVVAAHPLLRSRIHVRGGLPVLLADESTDLDVPVLDAPGASDELLQQILDELVEAPFDLTGGALLRVVLIAVGPDRHVLLVTVHHLVADDQSLRIFGEQVLRHYADPAQPVVAGPPPTAERDWRATPSLGERVDRRRAALAGVPPTVLPAPEGAVDPRSAWPARSAAFRLPAPAAAGWAGLRKDTRAGRLALELAACGCATTAAGGPADLLVGTPGFGRHTPGEWQSIGYYATTAVVRAAVRSADTFGDLVRQVAEDLDEAWGVQDVPYQEIVGTRAQSVAGGHLLWLVLYPDSALPQLPGLSVRPFPMPTGRARHDLRVGVFTDDDALEFTVDTRISTVDAAFAARFVDALRRLHEHPPSPTEPLRDVLARAASVADQPPVHPVTAQERLARIAAGRRRS